MMRAPFNTLFLCTGNSARSILAASPVMHFVFTVRDRAAGEVWPGHALGRMRPDAAADQAS